MDTGIAGLSSQIVTVSSIVQQSYLLADFRTTHIVTFRHMTLLQKGLEPQRTRSTQRISERHNWESWISAHDCL